MPALTVIKSGPALIKIKLSNCSAQSGMCQEHSFLIYVKGALTRYVNFVNTNPPRSTAVKSAIPFLCLSLLALAGLSACRTYPDYASDFRFPIEAGDIAQGREAFVRLGCPQCHTVAGETLPEYTGTRFITMPLGGELIFAKTYGNLVTSIINPNHIISGTYLDQLPAEQRRRINTSPMYLSPNMRVVELIDIVAFLNSRYSLLPGYTEYYY